jgi:hypothetical protein
MDGEAHRAIGRSRGGRTTAIHPITDRFCRPVRFLPTGGEVPDCVAAESLRDLMTSFVNVVLGDKGHDSNKVRAQIEAMGAAPNILPKSNLRYEPGLS